MKLSLAISPCPNDTFMFDALIHHKVDTEGLEFDVYFDDVEALNRKAFQNTYDVSKLSFHAITNLINDYSLLNSGAALGNNNGPLLICKKGASPLTDNSTIAIPGEFTTANMLLKIAFPNLKNTHEIIFSDIEQNVLDEKMDAGLIIHENRFTYHQRGLDKIKDLGQFWEEKFNLPIPLGGIAINKKLDISIHHKMDRVLKRSIEYAFANRNSSADFVKKHAQEMDLDVIRKHIDLYVNQYSLELDEKGKKAIFKLFDSCGVDSSNIFVS